MAIFKRKPFFVLLLLGLLWGCKSGKITQLAEKQVLKVTPSPLALHGDSVRFNLSAKLPSAVLKAGALYEVQVSYHPESADPLFLGSINFDAANFSAGGEQPELSQPFAFLYDEKYAKGQVYVKGILRKNDKIKESAAMPVPGAFGVITSSQLSQPFYGVSYIAHGYAPKDEHRSKSFDFFFSHSRPTFGSRGKRSKIAKDIESYLTAQKPITAINILGMHSPEGTTQANTKVVHKRSKAVEDYLKTLFKDSESAPNLIQKPVIESWAAFKTLLEANTKISDAQKEAIGKVVDGAGGFTEKERRLRALPAYRLLSGEIYPLLRKVKAEVASVIKGPTETEIITTAQEIAKGKESADKLTAAQLSFGAHKTADLKTRRAIYEALVKKDDGFAAYNNLGAVYLEMAEQESETSKKMALIDKALPLLEKSAEKIETPEGLVNMASVQMMKGDHKAAEKTLAKVTGENSAAVNKSANALRGIEAIRHGRYAEAIQFLSAAPKNSMLTYNKALAVLLQAGQKNQADGYGRAMEMFRDAVAADSRNAYAHYGLALAAARTKNNTEMLKALAKAVEISPELKKRAATDLEFAPFKTLAAFKNVLK